MNMKKNVISVIDAGRDQELYTLDVDKPDEKPLSTKQILEALWVLCRRIHRKGDSDVFKPHLVCEEIIKKKND